MQSLNIDKIFQFHYLITVPFINMSNPKISVITVCYNAKAMIELTIQSVLAQTYLNIEYIVIDGGSTDGTIDIIKKYKHRIARWISEPDRGIYDAMNKGIAAATGDYVNFMNAGDRFFDRTTIENMLANLHDDRPAVVYGNSITCFNGYRLLATPKPLKRLWKGSTICHQAVFCDLQLLKESPFDLSYRFAADYAVLLSLYTKGYSFCHVDMPICYYMAGGVSDTQSLKAFQEVRAISLCMESTPMRRAYFAWNTLKIKMKTHIKRMLWISERSYLLRTKRRIGHKVIKSIDE